MEAIFLSAQIFRYPVRYTVENDINETRIDISEFPKSLHHNIKSDDTTGFVKLVSL